jgi:hypothetical protein
MGEAIVKRDYRTLKALIAAGKDINNCEWHITLWKSGITGNVLSYASQIKDLRLMKFLLKNGAMIRGLGPWYGQVELIGKLSPEIFELLCKESYKRILKNTTPVYPQMIKGLIEYFKIKTTGFISKELINAAEDNNTEGAGDMLKTLIKNTRNKRRQKI